MANELNISISLSFVKSGYQTVTQSVSDVIDAAGGYNATGTQLIGTVDETLTIPADIATVGVCVFQNLDTTNYVDIGNDGSVYPIRLKAGQPAVVPFNGTPHLKANTAACRVAFAIIEA